MSKYLFGIDEVGRGPLAGPVVACALCFKCGSNTEGLNDSKKLSEKKRLNLDRVIKENSIWAISEVSNEVIDKINILNASLLAMENALKKVCEQNNITKNDEVSVIVDGNKLPKGFIKMMEENNCFKAQAIVKADLKTREVMAASIIAKNYRDNLMSQFDKKFPNWEFSKHKGYPTALHYKRIKEFGISPLHRKSFRLY